MANPSAFQPTYGSGQVVSPSGSSATVSISPDASQVCFTNLGASFCYVRVFAIENGAQAASAVDLPIPAGAQIVVSKGRQDRVSHQSAIGTTLHIMTGEGQ